MKKGMLKNNINRQLNLWAGKECLNNLEIGQSDFTGFTKEIHIIYDIYIIYMSYIYHIYVIYMSYISC